MIPGKTCRPVASMTWSASRLDPRAARSLLRQAGYKQFKSGLMGRGATPLTITLWADAACSDCAAALTLIARGWRAAGVATTIRLVPTATLFGTSGLL